jgi:hypothetical protein
VLAGRLLIEVVLDQVRLVEELAVPIASAHQPAALASAAQPAHG